MSRIFLLTAVVAFVLSPLALAETVIVDDHFDDGDVTTNTNGIGSGFNFWDIDWNATVTEADSLMTLSGPTHGGSRCSATSIDGAAIGTGVSRFAFNGVSFSVGNTGTGATARDCIGVKDTDETWDYDSGMPTGFWIQLENDSLSTEGGSGGWNGTSILFYEASDDTKTVLASWEFDTLNWDSGTQELTPVIDITLDLEADGYSLTIEGDTVTLLTGSLSNTYAAAGITNELTVGYVSSYIQSENPGIDISIDQIVMVENVAPRITRPYDGVAIPQNDDGSVGTVELPSTTVGDVDLTFKAGADPNFVDNGILVNPDIDSFVIHFQTDAPTDPNLYIVDAIAAGSMTDPNRIFYLSAYNPGAGLLLQGTTYKWQVEQVMIDPVTQTTYSVGDPNNISGPVWSFTTASATPQILTDPVNTLTDVTGASTLTISASTTADNYRWYKVGDPDEELVDGGIYSGTQTDELTITGQASDGSQDAQYYAIAYNGIPGESTTQTSEPSASAWVWYPRLVSHYTMETMDYVSDANGVTVNDVTGIYDMRMASNDSGSDVPVLDANSVAGLAGSVNSLRFDNPPGSDDPNNVFAQYAEVENPDLVAYDDISISVWVYSNGGAAWNRIVDFGNSNQDYIDIATNWWGDHGRVGSEIHVSGVGGAVVSPDAALADNEWTLITVTLSGDQLRLYMDGELVGGPETVTQNPISFSPTSQNWLARSQWGGGDGYFDGLMDDLKIWNYGLTADDVAQEYLDVEGDWVCDNESNDLAYDWNGNCIIDLEDFAVFAATWLDSYRIFPD